MGNAKISVKDLNLYYGENHALKDVGMQIKDRLNNSAANNKVNY